MDQIPLSFREVIPDQTHFDGIQRKDINLNTGATQSTLQDIKTAERAGGFCFKNAAKHVTRNRFIHWRTHHDVLELFEVSLDANLIDCSIRYRFTDAPVLSVNLFETANQVVILVVTVSSIHRLNFTHPDVLAKHASSDGVSMSVFREASAQTTRDPSTFHVIGHTAAASSNAIPHTATAWLVAGGQQAMFSLAYQTTLLLFTMDAQTGQTVSLELKEHTMVPRIFSSLTGALRGKSTSNDSQFVASLAFTDIGPNTFLYALYRDDHIRMWSTRNGSCVGTLNCVPDSANEPRPQGPQQNCLRRQPDGTLCTFLSYSLGAEFVTIRTDWDGDSRYQLVRTAVVQAPQFDLVDFAVDERRIWALWCNAQGEFNVSSYALLPGFGLNWVNAPLEAPADAIQHEPTTDPKDVYCAHIFHPGKFQRNVIAKALVMFRRSNLAADPNLTMAVLKDRVCQAIEAEMQNEVNGFDITDEEYIDISAKYWERFYSCCEQYHVKLCQPIGLFAMDSVGAVCVVKKATFSLLRPCELLEHLMLSGGDAVDEAELGSGHGSDVLAALGVDVQTGRDLVRLVGVLAELESQLDEEVKKTVHDRLYQLQMPNVVVAELLSGEFEENIFPRDFLLKVHQEIRAIVDLRVAMNMLLDMLRLDADESDEESLHFNLSQKSRSLMALGNLFGSDLGVSTLAESLKQIALIRYSMCRNLLVLQQILIDKFDLSCDVMEEVRSNCMPNTVVYVQAYYVMVWLCETPVQSGNSSASLDNNIQRLNALHIHPTSRRIARPLQPTTLLEFFLRTKGLPTALTKLVDGNPNAGGEQWLQTMLPLVTILGQQIWAVSGDFTFGEWLIGSCQHILVQEYARLLNTWCQWNNCSRHFIAGVSLLENGEPHKAFDLFMQSAKGVLTEPFLAQAIVHQQTCTENEAMTQYYLKVIQLFEQHNALDHVIALAKTAIGILEPNDPQLAMFQSIVFTNHLHLEHYDEAYHALIDNAESSRRKDCLRQLVVCLFQQKRLDLLMRFPYIRLQDELEEIVESRARSIGIESNPYYDFLFAFHVTKDNMRKAASIMYEQAMRYSTECDTIDGIQSRYECLLSCVNSLTLVDEKYAWIAKPVINEDSRGAGGADDMDTDDVTLNHQQVVVLEIGDVRKEMWLVEAMLTLVRHRQDLHSILNVGAEQIVAVLASNGLYTAAAKLGRGLDQSVAGVLESLAAACVRADEESSDETWNWLKENDLADVPHKNNAVEMAWKLLEKLLIEQERPSETILHKAITTKLITVGEFLPHWLYLSYKLANPSELLHLYVNNGRLIEAAALAIEYIWAMMSTGGEYFGLDNSLHSTKPALCFPVTAVDVLIYGLELNADQDPEYAECLGDLREVVKCYVDTANRVSRNKIDYLRNGRLPMVEA